MLVWIAVRVRKSVHRGVRVITTVTMTQPAAESVQLPLPASLLFGSSIVCKYCIPCTPHTHTHTQILLQSTAIHFIYACSLKARWIPQYKRSLSHCIPAHIHTLTSHTGKENACQQLGVIDLPRVSVLQMRGTVCLFKHLKYKPTKGKSAPLSLIKICTLVKNMFFEQIKSIIWTSHILMRDHNACFLSPQIMMAILYTFIY